jgi:Helicase HerA, central domain
MIRFLEQFFTGFWNRVHAWRQKPRSQSAESGTDLGTEVVDGETSRRKIGLSSTRRTMHVSILGLTGTGKSSMIRHMIRRDIERGRGFILFDIHGTLTPWVLCTIAYTEFVLGEHLSDRVVLIAPADREHSVAINLLESLRDDFVRIAEFTEILRLRWNLDGFGARTEELLRNSLFVLAANGLTLLELVPLLTNASFRKDCLRTVSNPEVRNYFEARYGAASPAMQAQMREPILNKTSAFTSDPRFRHLVGQTKSTFNLVEAMDDGLMVILDLPKGTLGEHALTLASLFFVLVRNAAFARRSRSLVTVYCDEVHNLVGRSADLETMLSEARKFGVGLVTANQHFEQFPAAMRAAIQSVGTRIYFQLSPADAAQVAQALDGGKSLAERLKNLPARHYVIKSGADRWREGIVPDVKEPKVNSQDLVARIRGLRSRPRKEIEGDIAQRHARLQPAKSEALDTWE